MTYSFQVKKGITITVFQKVLNKSNSEQKKIWVDKDSEFKNRTMKSWLQDNGIKIYSIHKEETFIFVQRFIRALKNEIYKYILIFNIKKCLY